ncbi:MAG: hypothetical protein FRX49_01682 [Trebouxia sp. A1-2]|nr:MAG: hypothetical protein FRX49_01682 [Trebouxia sp. A1-2]
MAWQVALQLELVFAAWLKVAPAQACSLAVHEVLHRLVGIPSSMVRHEASHPLLAVNTFYGFMIEILPDRRNEWLLEIGGGG